jgi:hypothetical protein
MDKTLLPIRLVFIVLCTVAGWLVCYTIPEWDRYWFVAVLIGCLIGLLVVLVDVLLKGFSLRGLSAITFGIGVGALISYMLGVSPAVGGRPSGDLSREAWAVSRLHLSRHGDRAAREG